jgi:dihydrofolate synthase / folylpolyglutamate synthase
MRTLDDWLEYQQRQHVRSIDLGLARVREVAQRLGVLPLPCPVVLVAGTNGKGSTVAHLAAFGRAAGLRTATFTSPHLVRYNERIAFDGEPVDDASLVAAFERVEAARGTVPLTFFEYNTLAAFELFARRAPQLAIVEVGLGGRLDAANLLDADVAVITSIGLDHTDWLGPTLEHIGAEKAGVLRAGGAAVLGSADMPHSVRTAIESLRVDARWPGRDFEVRREAEGRWQYLGREWRLRDLPPSALAGAIQYASAVAALEALSGAHPALRAAFGPAVVAEGLRAVRLAGRFQVVARAPEWILDVAHNVPAAEILAANLRARPATGRSIAVVGILADKDIAGIGRALAPCIDEWVLCGLDGPRGTDAEALRHRLPPECAPLSLVTDVAAACELARSRARPEDRIVVLGSFHTVGPALQWLGL